MNTRRVQVSDPLIVSAARAETVECSNVREVRQTWVGESLDDVARPRMAVEFEANAELRWAA